jgi:hypothetical protein
MTQQIYIGDFKGLSKYKTAFNIDNTSFPVLFNAYAWRGRVKRKRGTSLLDRLRRQVKSVLVPSNPWEYAALALVGGVGNLITSLSTSLEANSRIAPGSIDLFLGGDEYTEPSTPDGSLLKNGISDPGSTINYNTGAITIAGGGIGPLTGTFEYFPNLPVMGLEDFITNNSVDTFPQLLAFDTKYSYQVNQVGGQTKFVGTSYYKSTNIPFTWSADDASLFFTTNYQSALWATNNKVGFHYVNGVYSAGTGTTDITFIFTSQAVPYQDLIVGDKIWFNEWPDVVSPLVTANGLVGTVLTIVNAATGTYIVRFDVIQTISGTGIGQLLTNSIAGQDGIKWYDGDPTAKTDIPTGTGLGWVNFAPPLTNLTVSINEQQLGKYYLVGALAVVPFKDRLLFLSPIIQTASVGSLPIQRPLQDVVLWCWNGTPYYNSLVPTNTSNSETFDVSAWYVDQTGKAGWQSAGLAMPIATVNNNEDVLLIGFGGKGRKTRFAYTGNDLQPFIFYNINAELPSSSTFSSISLDAGSLDIGEYGIAITTQQSSERIDMEIPDEVFQIQKANSGDKRVNALRDFYREWIYFCYPVASSQWKFPTQTFMYNYRENAWSILYENYTVQGNFRKQTKNTWKTISQKYKTWANWRDPWNSANNASLFAQSIAGNPQGYVIIRDDGTGEAQSGEVANISANLGSTQITSVNHCVKINDYLYFESCIGNTYLNGKIARVIDIVGSNAFVIDIPFSGAGYLGLGVFRRLSQPNIKTKEFPVFWEAGRKTRLGVQKYLFDRTANAQVTVEITLSMNPENPWNAGNILPQNDVDNSALIYSQTVYTCPESTNLGLTPPNTNLQMITGSSQNQIWHRMNTSLIGDTVQVGVTLSDEQMRNLTFATSEIALHGIVLNMSPGPQLA